ncbi:MAG TPA: DUF2279 domain-containing protein [Bacteroidota bacterium]|jgi:hypothetical protein|nr:DUF2279 domain-containing protein [Bacteroidota bacterium]
MARFAFILIIGCIVSQSSAAYALEHPRSADLSLNMFYPGITSVRPFPEDTTQRGGGEGEQINTGRLWLVGGTLLTSMVVIHVYQQNGWWKENRAPFHFQEDLVYGLSVDKIGHFFGGYLMGYSIQKCVEWANVPECSAVWIGAAGGLLFQTYVEVEDGFSTWGFDRVDFASDVLGSAWLVGRYYVPSLRNVDLKMSYHSSSLLGTAGGSGFKGQQHLVIDDYEGQTFWMSVKMHNILPKSPFQRYWPSFLCLAVGYGARDVAGVSPYRVLVLAPDLDMTEIIPRNTSFLKTLGEVLNFIHLPLPAVQVSPNAIWYGVYF